MGVTTMREGAVRWMAPEVIDSGHCTTEGDIYSLGCVFLEVSPSIHLFIVVILPLIRLFQIFSEAPPFPQLRNDNQVISWIIQGKRPSWQTKSKDVSIAETEVETFAKQCWMDEPSGRPRIGSWNLGNEKPSQLGPDVFNTGSFSPLSSARAAPQQTQSLEPISPLEMSANRWIPMSIRKKGRAVPKDSPVMVDRMVNALLNKLTMKHFDSISDQIIAWANKSEKETNGRTLIQVIRLVFERAMDEAAWSEMYARLCQKMMEQISPNVHDDGVKSADGNPIVGGQLFRKYLLNRCQEDFERGWATNEAIAAAAASKVGEDQAAKTAAETEVTLYSDEYYAAQKAKRQSLGLVKFISELFKLSMITERIMHECVKKLLVNVDNPIEEIIESLCQLLTTAGALLDTPKARRHMDAYFSRMKELTKHPDITPRLQFMLQVSISGRITGLQYWQFVKQDVVELRERNWMPRNQAAAQTQKSQREEKQRPQTISQTHEAVSLYAYTLFLTVAK